MGNISRRQFIKGMAVAGAGIAGASVLGGCGQAGVTTALPSKWDKEVDVVVVGAGTGLTGALAAAVGGAKTLVLEKAAAPGGSTGISGGWAWIPNNPIMKTQGIEDSREKALTYLRLIAAGQADEELITTFVDRGPEMVEFVAANAPIVWGLASVAALGLKAAVPCNDYHPEWPGGIPVGRSLARYVDGKQVGGGSLIDGLVEGCKAKGVEILCETPARKLITRIDANGVQEILGVVAEQEGKTIYIKARKAVLLTAGGFDWDFTWKMHFLRGPTPYATGVPTLTGDGIRMAMAAGADLRNMNECWGMPVYKAQAEEYNAKKQPAPLTFLLERFKPGVIMVNRYGERFCNEASDYDTIWRSFFTWENWLETGYRNIPAWAIFDNSVRTNFTIGGATPDKELPAWVKQADTLKELAEAIGVDPAGLEKTVADWNEQVKQGKDPWFHRGESLYDRAWAGTGIDGPLATLGPIANGPFFAAEVAVADIGTCGGARVNANSQVLNPFGVVIPRLYAAGNNSGVGGPGAFYGGPGGTIGPCMTFAYIAGKHAATLEPWK